MPGIGVLFMLIIYILGAVILYAIIKAAVTRGIEQSETHELLEQLVVIEKNKEQQRQHSSAQDYRDDT